MTIDVKLNVLSAERAEKESNILSMVEKTLNNSEKSINEWKEI